MIAAEVIRKASPGAWPQPREIPAGGRAWRVLTTMAGLALCAWWVQLSETTLWLLDRALPLSGGWSEFRLPFSERELCFAALVAWGVAAFRVLQGGAVRAVVAGTALSWMAWLSWGGHLFQGQPDNLSQSLIVTGGFLAAVWCLDRRRRGGANAALLLQAVLILGGLAAAFDFPWGGIPGKMQSERWRGLFFSPNSLGAAMGLGLLWLTHRGAEAEDGIRRGGWRLWLQAGAWAACALCLAGAQSRAAFWGVCGALGLSWMTALVRRQPGLRRRILWSAGGLLLCLLLLPPHGGRRNASGTDTLAGRGESRIFKAPDASDGSTMNRLEAGSRVLAGVRAHWLAGAGWEFLAVVDEASALRGQDPMDLRAALLCDPVVFWSARGLAGVAGLAVVWLLAVRKVLKLPGARQPLGVALLFFFSIQALLCGVFLNPALCALAWFAFFYEEPLPALAGRPAAGAGCDR